MKGLFRLLLRLAVLGGLGFVFFSTNPPAERHKEAISRQMTRLAEKDPLQRIPQILYGVADLAGVYPFEYRDFRLWSVMREEDRNVTLGILGRVYVLKTDFTR